VQESSSAFVMDNVRAEGVYVCVCVFVCVCHGQHMCRRFETNFSASV